MRGQVEPVTEAMAAHRIVRHPKQLAHQPGFDRRYDRHSKLETATPTKIKMRALQ
jgi:hypothetical protein